MNFDSIDSIIDFAIEKEIEAQNIYLTYAGRTSGKGLRKLLLTMVDQEKEHEKRLKELKESGDISHVLPDKKVIDIKIGDYAVDVEFSEDMSYQDFLLLVIKREEKSLQLYKWLEGKTSDSDAKYLFSRLAEEEKKHKAWAQDRYDLEILTDN